MSPRDIYLETQVSTATPQRLRLMLIEGAIRQARLTAENWRQQRDNEALESLIRCRAMVGELLSGVREGESELGRTVVGLYVFLFKTLTDLRVSRDAAALEAAIAVLEEERQTWSQLCQQFANAPDAGSRAVALEEAAPARVNTGLSSNSGASSVASELSFEA
jgi:flagellar protein FliS